MPHELDLKPQLSHRFKSTNAFSNAPETTQDTWTNEFLSRYTEPHRRYHTLTHIDSMLKCYDQASIDDEAVVLAIIFHDWVYEPLRKDNELESARVFEKFARETVISSEVTRTVKNLIEATITHTPHDHDERTKLFLDFDLEVLSRPREEYDVYARQIRDEYAHVEDEAYQVGRSDVLETFLGRDRIYFSEQFAAREHSARENMLSEISRLKSGGRTVPR